MIKKADIILAIILLVLGISASVFSVMNVSDGQTVVIYADGQEFGRYDLAQDQRIEVKQQGHSNEIIIKDGSVSMIFSDCKNQVCVNTGKVSKTSQSIVCLPNKVMVEIESGGEPEYDAIAN